MMTEQPVKSFQMSFMFYGEDKHILEQHEGE